MGTAPSTVHWPSKSGSTLQPRVAHRFLLELVAGKDCLSRVVRKSLTLRFLNGMAGLPQGDIEPRQGRLDAGLWWVARTI